MGRIERERAEFDIDGQRGERIGRNGIERVRSRRMTTAQMIEKLRNNPDVELVEPNYIIRASATPNDPHFPSLWGLLNTGQTVDGRPGTPGADIAAVPAWDFTTGWRSNVVAVIDSGIDYTHPDLAANVWAAPRAFTVTLSSRTVSCAAGTRGYNAVTKTCDPMDDNGHGTHVAGIIGAVGNNGIGMTGVNWNASMMAVKILGVDGLGTIADAIEAIDFIVETKAALGADANVRVMNASWGVGEFSQALDAEIAIANNYDILFVASAGSEGQNNDASPHFPASGIAANIISVGSIDNTGALAGHSNYGSTSVDLAAPGDSALSTLPNGGYGTMSGSSMAAPFVSGAAALTLGMCPSNTATLKSRLIASVDVHSSLVGKTVSGGSLNVATALQNCVASVQASINGSTITAAVTRGPGSTVDWLGLYCPATLADGAYIDWKYLNGTRTAPANGITSATVTFAAPAQPGVSCNVRLFHHNGMQKLATSGTVVTASTPTLQINDVSAAEGNSGSKVFTFTVTASPVNPSQTITVNYATANGSASTGDNDYVAASGTLTFAPSAATQTINVTVHGDTVPEHNETFFVNLSNPVNAVIGDGQGLGTITTEEVPIPTVTVAATTAAPGATINFSVSGGPAFPKDWVALAPVSASEYEYLDWKFLNGQRTAPATGVTAATMQFTAPTTPGTYQIRFYENNSYTRLATSASISVGPSIRLAATSVLPGDSIGFTVSGGPANLKDWVGLFPRSAPDTGYTDWIFLNGQRTAPSSGMSGATLQFTAPTTPGTYNLRFFADNGFTRLAISETFTVGPTLTVASTTVARGGSIEVTVRGGPANLKDWVGLARVSAPDTEYLDWKFLNGQRTAPATGLTTATLQFTAPSTPGTYEMRFYADNGFTRLATSATITVP
jgi:hypothetical protein